MPPEPNSPPVDVAASLPRIDELVANLIERRDHCREQAETWRTLAARSDADADALNTEIAAWNVLREKAMEAS